VNKLQCQQIFERLHAQNPNPTTELVYHSAFELLIAVILSAQATDASVNKATARLFPVANTPQSLLELGEEPLKQKIKTIGLYNTKAANIIKTCRLLIQNHQGQVPNSREALEALPGVGRKTANVILNTAFGHPTMAVDTHIFRVANRTGLAHAKTPLAVEQQLLKRIPKPFLQNAHHWLILHGRYVCTARNPHCGQCLIREWCDFPDKTSP
jgi:endonuclease-3